MKVVVLGGGPAGMLAAITAAENGHQVILIEKNKTLGKKLLITGKGRCNITSSLPIDEFIKNVLGNGKFLYSAFQNYTNQDIISFLKKQGLDVKEERGNRIFPVTDKSIDVLRCFENKINELNIEVLFNRIVTDILVEDEKVKGVRIKETTTNSKLVNKVLKEKKTKFKLMDTVNLKEDKIISADKVILATGGKSCPLTGSTGDGYILAQKLGHTITDIKPSLVPLVCHEKDLCQEMQGLSLKNVKIRFEDTTKKKILYEDFGEMLFTHFGVSGPIILSGSSHLVRYKNLEDLLKNKKIILYIDLKPALSTEKLDERILRDFLEFKNKKFKNSLDKLLPKKMIEPIIKLSNINPEKDVNEITKIERHNLVNLLKDFKFTIEGFRSIDEAIITSGGINVKEVNPKTMESKIVKGLYFAGEVLDVDAYTGGFNLQIAYSTGFTAGRLL